MLLAAYLTEFSAADPVALYLKTMPYHSQTCVAVASMSIPPLLSLPVHVMLVCALQFSPTITVTMPARCGPGCAPTSRSQLPAWTPWPGCMSSASMCHRCRHVALYPRAIQMQPILNPVLHACVTAAPALAVQGCRCVCAAVQGGGVGAATRRGHVHGVARYMCP